VQYWIKDIKAELSSSKELVSDKDKYVLNLIYQTDLACHELKRNKEKAKQDLITTFDELRQQTRLLERLDQTCFEKDKNLKLELNQLQLEHQGIKSALLFTNKLLESGNDLEFALSKDSIIDRFNHFINDKHITSLQESLPDLAYLTFIAPNKSLMFQTIQQFGSIDENLIKASPLNSFIQGLTKGMNTICTLNQPKIINIILKDSDGNLVEQGEEKHIKVQIKGPSKPSLIEMHGCDQGRYEVKFIPNVLGNHEMDLQIKKSIYPKFTFQSLGIKLS